MISAFGTQRRFGQATGRRSFQRGMRRLTTTGGPVVVNPIVVPGFTRSGGFFGRFGVGGEMKFHDLAVDDTAIATGGTIASLSLNLIAQGTTESERIGRKCTIRSVNIRFEVRLPTQTAGASASDVARIIVYQDKQANGATAAVLDILKTADYQSFNQLSNKSRFRTLMDRTYDVNSLAGGGDGTTEDYGQTIISDTLFKKVNIPIEFNGATGAITEVKSNNIGILTISRTGNAAFASNVRLRFSDN